MGSVGAVSVDQAISKTQIGLSSKFNSWKTTSKIITLKIASYLTDPICKVREYFYTFYILDEICKTTAQKVSQVAFLVLGIIIFAMIAPFTSPIGALLRKVVSCLESKPFIYIKRNENGKELPNGRVILTLVSHNQCYIPGGYSISDGQVLPLSYRERLDNNIRAIKEASPDIVCLYEVTDINDASYISSKLLEYPFIIPVAGTRAIGPSSMLYIASKYEIEESSIEFVPFKKGSELTGRAKFSEKGFLSFDIKGSGKKVPFATIISTHLQHSEIPAQPEKQDVVSRSMQMRKITNHIEQKLKKNPRAVIFTGDLNQEEAELSQFLNHNHIKYLKRDPAIQGKSTWGGDEWCSKLMNKQPSKELVLDYTLIAGKARRINTEIFKTGYSCLKFSLEARSDHYGLRSKITIGGWW